MRFILLATLLLGPTIATPAEDCPCVGYQTQCKQAKAIKAIADQLNQLYKNIKPPKGSIRPPVQQLAPKLLRGWHKHGIRPELMMRILAVESKFDLNAYNAATDDYGLVQLNARTARAMGVTTECQLAWPCLLEAGYAVAAYSLKRGNICFYNTGPGPLRGKRKFNCNRYLTKLEGIKI